jgi:predicted dehydrogenase
VDYSISLVGAVRLKTPILGSESAGLSEIWAGLSVFAASLDGDPLGGQIVGGQGERDGQGVTETFNGMMSIIVQCSALTVKAFGVAFCSTSTRANQFMESTKNPTEAGRDSRRGFIRKAAAAAAVVASSNIFKTPVYGQSQAPSTGRVLGANDRIVVGFVGVGGQGLNAHINFAKKLLTENNLALAAVCDVSRTRVSVARESIGGDCAGFLDYRKLLERNDIDAVFCSTVDHWHRKITVDTLNAGKHVYVEKPMTRYLSEAFEIYDTVKKTGKILQAGSQGCSDLKWHKAAEWIQDGMIGQVVMCQGSYMRNNPNGEWNYAIQPWLTAEDTDWDAWLGPEIKQRVAFNADHYFRWRKYHPYCSGLLGDLVPHKLHPYMLATGNPEFPSRVACVGTKPVLTDKNTPGTPIRDVPEIVQLIAEFPSGMVMHVTSSSINEMGTQEMIRGHQGNLLMAGNRVELRPERPFTDEIDFETSPPFPPEDIGEHHKNFFASIRSNQQPNAGIDLATKVQTVVSLAEMSDRLNMMCLFDEKTRKITTADGHEVEPLSYGSREVW